MKFNDIVTSRNLLIVLAISTVVLFHLINRKFKLAEEQDFHKYTNICANEIELQSSYNTRDLEHLGEIIATKENLTLKEFNSLAKIYLKNSELRGLSINPIVYLSDTADFLVKAKKTNSEYRIWKPKNCENYEDSFIVPVAMIAPIDKNKKALGLNINCESKRKHAIHQCLISNKLTGTAPIRLVQNNSDLKSTLILYPLSGERKGFLVGVYDLETLFKINYFNIVSKVTVYDVTQNIELCFEQQLQNLDSKSEYLKSSQYFSAAGRDYKIIFEKARKDHGLVWIICSLYVLLFTIILLVVKSKKERSKNLLRTIKEAEDNSKKMESLMKEIHHRVKNNLQIILSLIYLEKRKNKSNNALQAIQNIESRIYSMAALHEKLYQSEDLDEIDLIEYIEDIVKYVQSISHEKYHYKIHKNTDPKLNIEKCLPLGLIIHELINNSIKHSNQAVAELLIEIEIEKSKDGVAIKYRDNGSKNENSPIKEGLGTSLIKNLSKQLRAELDIEHKTNGYEATITLP